jgi:hypothetical protein
MHLPLASPPLLLPVSPLHIWGRAGADGVGIIRLVRPGLLSLARRNEMIYGDEIYGQVAKKMLEKLGCTAEVAGNGEM